MFVQCTCTCFTDEEEHNDRDKTPANNTDGEGGMFEDTFSEEGEDDIVGDLEYEVMKSSNFGHIRTRQ